MSDFGYDFGSKFMLTKGQPFSYGNKELVMIHKFPVMKGDVLTVTIEETNSRLIQGVGITEEVEIFGRLSKRPVIWETFSIEPEKRKHTKSILPFSFEVKAIKKGLITIYNMCLYDGRQEWWHYGSCMYCETAGNITRFFCNDFQPNDDFNDLVFSVETIAR